MSSSSARDEMEQSQEQRMLLAVALYSGAPLDEDDDEEQEQGDVSAVKESNNNNNSWSLGGIMVVSATLLTAFFVLLVGAALSGKGCSMMSLGNKNKNKNQPSAIPYQLRGSSSSSLTSYAAEKNVPFSGIPNQKKPCGKKIKQQQQGTKDASTQTDVVTDIMLNAHEAALKQFVQDSKKAIDETKTTTTTTSTLTTEDKQDDIFVATKEELAVMPSIMDMSGTAATPTVSTTALKQKKPCDKNKKTPESQLLGVDTSSVSEMNQVAPAATTLAHKVPANVVVEAKQKMPCGKKGVTTTTATTAVVSNKMMTTTTTSNAVKPATVKTVVTAVDPLPVAVLPKESEDEDESKATKSNDDDGSLDGAGTVSNVVAYDDDNWLMDESIMESSGAGKVKGDEFAVGELPMAAERLEELEDEEP